MIQFLCHKLKFFSEYLYHTPVWFVFLDHLLFTGKGIAQIKCKQL